MFRVHRAHHQEGQIVSIQPLVTVLLPEAVLIQFVSPDDEHDVLKTCRVINRNKYIEKNLCITLVTYQESLHESHMKFESEQK